MRMPPNREHRKTPPPRIKEHAPGACWHCGRKALKGQQLCKECDKAVEDQWRNQERSEAEHLKRRAKEAQKREAEWEKWREKRREQYRKEAEAYEVLKEERRAAKQAEENEEWYEFLRDLAQMSQRGA